MDRRADHHPSRWQHPKKVYTRQAVSQIDGTGSLIAAENLTVHVTGDVNNQGQLVGYNTLNLKSLNLTNENGGVIAGDYLQVGLLTSVAQVKVAIAQTSCSCKLYKTLAQVLTQAQALT